MRAEVKTMTCVGCTAILLMIGAISLDYCNALRCYTCGSPLGDFCSNPLDTTHEEVQEDECKSAISSCLKARVDMAGTLELITNKKA